MKFGQFMYYYKGKIFIKRFYVKCVLETSSSSFLILKESSVKGIWGGLDADLDKFPNILLIHI